MSPSLKQVPKEFEGYLRRHLGKDVSQLKTCVDGDDFGFLLSDLFAKPDVFNGIVLAARSKLRRQSSCKNKCARIVFVNSDMHSAGIGFIVIRILDTNGNANFINEGNDGQEFAATTSQGNDPCFHGGSGCLGLKFGRPKDGASDNCNDIARATVHTNRVIVVLIAIETGKIIVRVGINTNGCGRLDDHSLVLGSNKVAANPLDCDFV